MATKINDYTSNHLCSLYAPSLFKRLFDLVLIIFGDCFICFFFTCTCNPVFRGGISSQNPNNDKTKFQGSRQ